MDYLHVLINFKTFKYFVVILLVLISSLIPHGENSAWFQLFAICWYSLYGLK